VAFWLWDEFLGPRQRSLIAGSVDLILARRRAAALAGLHDLGKASPAFQSSAKNPDRAAAVERAGLSLAGARSRSTVHHAVLSARFVFEHLTGQGVPTLAATWAALVVGGHHGSFPSSYSYQVGTLLEVGGAAWAAARHEFADRLLTHAGVRPDDWDKMPSVPGQLTTAGLVILADWLASNTQLFAYTNGPVDDYRRLSEHRARSIPTVLDVGRPWRPEPARCTDVTTLFGHRWPGRPPRPIQQLAYDVGRRAGRAGLLVIEAPMGEGKSEAALVAAEVIAARSGADGVFLGLPTQATANQQFRRIKSWLSTFEGPDPTFALAHGKARRQADYQQVLVRGVDADEPSGAAVLAALDWLAGRKKALLAHVVVGTVDQLLLAGVAARHVALRHLALAGKVVIVDEVHAYDAYMSTILHRVLEWLGAEGVPVILLSATLASRSRRELLSAYAGATGAAVGHDAGYPLVTWVDAPNQTGASGTVVPVTQSCGAARSSTAGCELRAEADDGAQVAHWAVDLVASGGCVLIIRNTVARAQETFAALRNLLHKDECTLVHAAFTTADRGRLDNSMTSRFGAPDQDGRSPGRPTRHVVVATQVLEQSLDVDFDLLISDLAPIDLLLQRLGRVWRHSRTDRAAGFGGPRMIVVGFQHRVDQPPVVPSGSALVYGEHLMARTAAVLMDRDAHPIAIPADVPGLVDAVYDDRPVGPDSWQNTMITLAELHAAQQGRLRETAHGVLLPAPSAESLEKIGYGDDQPPEDGDSTPLSHVRYGPPSMEVLLLRRTSDPKLAVTVSGEPEHEIPLDRTPPPSLMEAVLDQTVRLPHRLVDAVRDNPDVAPITAWRWSPWLRNLPVLLLNSDNSPTRIRNVHCTYSPTNGLAVLTN
jgi:CRISPR-associated helicase Cas3/CRISPR-associated endonuclease Cas3-HD